MKLRLVYVFSIVDDGCCNDIYNMHYDMLNQISHCFDEIIIIINNQTNNGDIEYKVRSLLINILNCNDITFIIERFNNINIDNLYKKYVLNEFIQHQNYMIFFAHNIGVNEQNINDDYKQLIFGLYYLSMHWLKEVKDKLQTLNTYGSLYVKNENNWSYLYDFAWHNGAKLSQYQYKNINNLCGYFNETLCGFHNDEIYNKRYIIYDIDKLPYSDIIKLHLLGNEYDEFLNNFYNNKLFN